MSRKNLLIVVVVASVAATWWVLGRQSPPDPTSGPTPTVPTSTTSTVSVPAQTATSRPTRSTTSPTTNPEPGAELPARDKAAVGKFAIRFMQAFARPAGSVPTQRWWKQVSSMLADDAIDTYRDITPDQVPFTKVTGSAVVQPLDPDSDEPWVQPVMVPTNAGRWLLLIELPTTPDSTGLKVLEVGQA